MNKQIKSLVKGNPTPVRKKQYLILVYCVYGDGNAYRTEEVVIDENRVSEEEIVNFLNYLDRVSQHWPNTQKELEKVSGHDIFQNYIGISFDIPSIDGVLYYIEQVTVYYYDEDGVKYNVYLDYE